MINQIISATAEALKVDPSQVEVLKRLEGGNQCNLKALYKHILILFSKNKTQTIIKTIKNLKLFLALGLIY
jgi:hypothetical protein